MVPVAARCIRQLTLLVEDDADCFGIGPGDEEYPKEVTRRTAEKRAVHSFHQALIKNRLTDLGKSDGTAINSQTDLALTSLRSEPKYPWQSPQRPQRYINFSNPAPRATELPPRLAVCP